MTAPPAIAAPRTPSGAVAPGVGGVDARRALHIGYVTSRFPKLTETFILYEVLGLERAGARVELYPLVRERTDAVHAEARPVVDAAHFLPFLSGPILRSQLRFLRREPRRYLSTLLAVVRGTWRNPNFLVGGIGTFPKVVHMAGRLRAAGVTHVHCHFATHSALAGFVIRRLIGIPFSFTAQGSDLHVDRTMLCEKVQEAAFVVAISDYNRDLIVEECGDGVRDKVRVIHSGIDTAFFRPASGGRRDGRFSILCVGTLHEVKGQRYLLEACRRLADAGIEATCRLVGEGPDREDLERRATALGLGERVVFLGARPRDEVVELIRTADVLVTPSVPTKEGKREGIPVVLMEALATGVPVVASRLSGIPELVEGGRVGLLVPPRDAAALADALRLLHDRPELRTRLGEAGRRKVVAEFDAWTNAARLAGAIGAVGADRGRAHRPA
jgi:glycosyltransferase involved in cell wall biosynthesis